MKLVIFCLLSIIHVRCSLRFLSPVKPSRSETLLTATHVGGKDAVDFKPNPDNPWQIRRQIVRETLSPIMLVTSSRLLQAQNESSIARKGTAANDMKSQFNSGAANSAALTNIVSKQSKAERSAARKVKREEDARLGVILTTFFVATSAIVLRLGGRGALLNILGLDFVNSSEIGGTVTSFVDAFQNAGQWAILGYFAAWMVAKFSCLDFIGVTLALSSGVLFGGVGQGTAVAVVASTLASLTVFTFSRTYLQEDIIPEINKRPLLRAVDRAVAKEGFKTVFVLRLSPVLPIPIGAYNYLYGVTSVTLLDFVTGTGLACIKPYFLDAYLGVFGKSMIDHTQGGGGMEDALLLVVVGLIIGVGTLATQVAGNVFDEIKSEAKLIEGQTTPTLASALAAPPHSAATHSSNPSQNSTFISKLFSLADGTSSSTPSWLGNITNAIADSRARLDSVIIDELVSISYERQAGYQLGWDGTLTDNKNKTSLAIPTSIYPQSKLKIEHMRRYFRDAVYKQYTFPGIRQHSDFESNNAAINNSINAQSAVDSLVFGFLLFGWAFAYMDDDNFIEEEETLFMSSR